MHRLDLFVADRARPAGTRLVQQPIETLGDEPDRHFATVARCTPSSSPTSTFDPPCAQRNTIRERSANA